MAESASTVMKAFSFGLSFSMRVRQSRVRSTGETVRWRICWLTSWMVVDKGALKSNIVQEVAHPPDFGGQECPRNYFRDCFAAGMNHFIPKYTTGPNANAHGPQRR